MGAKPILIVDDEKNIRLTLAQALEALELETDAAMNGEEALAKVAEKDYGLMLLDLKMPGMDGLEVLRRIRDIRPDIVVIIITAHGTIEAAVDAMKQGAVDFIQKPFTPNEIRALVRHVLDRDKLGVERASTYDGHIERAKKCISQRQFDAAREHVRQAIAADATQAEAFNLLGVLMELGGGRLEAQKNYRAALALDPTHKAANENLDRTVGIKRGSKIDLGE